MRDDAGWWPLRKTSTTVPMEWGHTHGTLFGTQFEMYKGPPVTIRFSLEHSLRKRGDTYDAVALVGGGMS